MTLEKTIQDIFKQIHNEEEKSTETIERENREREKQKYICEFDSRFKRVNGIEEAKYMLISWADKQEINDARKIVHDGASFYAHLVRSTQEAYMRFRNEGYCIVDSFEKATSDFERWVIKSLEKRNVRGQIYLNHTPEFIHRLIKLSMLD